MLEFESVDSFEIKGRGKVFLVKNPQTCENFIHLWRQRVKIDDKFYTVRGIEHQGLPPYPKNMLIGLLVQ
jgi:hypothetical protein